MMPQFRLTRILFSDESVLEPADLTVVIGPNNVGKSRLLREIADKVTKEQSHDGLVVREVEWIAPENLSILLHEYPEIERYKNKMGAWTYRIIAPDLCNEHHVTGGEWRAMVANFFPPDTPQKKRAFAENFGRLLTVFLNTENRLRLLKEAPSMAEERQTANLLQMLYNMGSDVEAAIRVRTKEAFGYEVALDFTSLQRLLLRVGSDFSSIPGDPRDAKPLLEKYEKLDDHGDGIRSFLGVAVALAAVRRPLFLIDEPEAFLHPPQAYRMGQLLAESAGKNCQIMAATTGA